MRFVLPIEVRTGADRSSGVHVESSSRWVATSRLGIEGVFRCCPFKSRRNAAARWSTPTLKLVCNSATISLMNTETIRRGALSLPVQARAELAEQLLSSLDSLSEAEIAELWLAEAARRAEDIDRGASKRVSADEVRRQAQAFLK